MNEILEGLEGVICLIDDVLVFGKDDTEHNSCLTEVLERLQTVGVTLNQAKSAFRQSSVKFLGRVISKEDVN